MVGGSGGIRGIVSLTSVEVIGDKKCSMPQLPFRINWTPQVILTNNNELLICGGSSKRCLVLNGGQWVQHSFLNQARQAAASVTMPSGVYILGGYLSSTSSEFLPNESTNWQNGPIIPDPGFEFGCAIKKSNFEIILIGGFKSKHKILQLNTITNDWISLGKLQEGRYAHACAVIDNKILVTGGSDHLTSAEIIPMYNSTNLELVGHLNERRDFHGSAVAHVNGKQTLLAFGGCLRQENKLKLRSSIEQWNPENRTWTILTNLKLTTGKNAFGYLSVPAHLLCP